MANAALSCIALLALVLLPVALYLAKRLRSSVSLAETHLSLCAAALPPVLVACYVLGRPPLIRPWPYLVLLALVQSGGVSLAVLVQHRLCLRRVPLRVVPGVPELPTAAELAERRVVVTAATRGKQPTWGGFLPQFLGYEVCQQMLRVLLSEEPVPYLEEGAAAVLAARRAEVQGWLAPRVGGVEVTDEEIRWWTFAGGRINATLRYALEAIGGWKVIPDNLVIKVRGEGLSEARFREAVAQLREVEFWENEKLWADVAELLPAFRLSKFQLLMPPWVERELVATHLLDVAGAWRWLTGAETTGLPQVPAGVRGVRREEARPAEEDVREVRPERQTRAVGEVEAQEKVEREAAVAPSPPPVSAAAPAGFRWVDTAEQLQQVVAELEREAVLGLDVETTLAGRSLCLMQIATRSHCYLIDALEVADLSPLTEVLASARIRKVIHNASFERSVLGRHGLLIDGVVDTLEISRARYGRKLEGGHSLKAVCARELGLEMSKEEQTSDWARRPLSERQMGAAGPQSGRGVN